jgi:hypothetical protein
MTKPTATKNEPIRSAPVVSIKEMQFNNGSTVRLDGNDFVVVVGPNNCGKSVTLRNINDHLEGGLSGKPHIVPVLSITRKGSVDELWDLISAAGISRSENTEFFGHRIQKKNVEKFFWNGRCSVTILVEIIRFFSQGRQPDRALQQSWFH